jgi:hypothetical protein
MDPREFAKLFLDIVLPNLGMPDRPPMEIADLCAVGEAAFPAIDPVDMMIAGSFAPGIYADKKRFIENRAGLMAIDGMFSEFAAASRGCLRYAAWFNQRYHVVPYQSDRIIEEAAGKAMLEAASVGTLRGMEWILWHSGMSRRCLNENGRAAEFNHTSFSNYGFNSDEWSKSLYELCPDSRECRAFLVEHVALGPRCVRATLADAADARPPDEALYVSVFGGHSSMIDLERCFVFDDDNFVIEGGLFLRQLRHACTSGSEKIIKTFCETWETPLRTMSYRTRYFRIDFRIDEYAPEILHDMCTIDSVAPETVRFLVNYWQYDRGLSCPNIEGCSCRRHPEKTEIIEEAARVKGPPATKAKLA